MLVLVINFLLNFRENPRVSQPLMPNNVNLLSRSNYKSIRRTIVLIHGWMNSATSNFNSVLLRGE